jgi:CRP-like cAMP-binding protein
MAEIELPAGQIIFSKCDPADRLFVPTEGVVEIVENGAKIQAGEILGEVGLFTGTGVRTMTARCMTDCKVRTMTAREVDNLYFKQPEFALALVKIMATRMTENVQKLEQRLLNK